MLCHHRFGAAAAAGRGGAALAPLALAPQLQRRPAGGFQWRRRHHRSSSGGERTEKWRHRAASHCHDISLLSRNVFCSLGIVCCYSCSCTRDGGICSSLPLSLFRRLLGHQCSIIGSSKSSSLISSRCFCILAIRRRRRRRSSSSS